MSEWRTTHARTSVGELMLRPRTQSIDAFARMPPAFLPHVQWSTTQEDLQNLSETVQQSEPYSYAWSGYGDLWKAEPTPSIAVGDLEGQLVIKVFRGTVHVEDHEQELLQRLLEAIKTSNALRSQRGGHPNIVPVFGFVTNMGNFPSPVTPYYSNGNALHFLAKETDADKSQIITDVANALKFIHALDPPVIHGNLKASNVLIDDNGHALISDTGLYIVVSESKYRLSVANIAGEFRWMAPEVLEPPEPEEDVPKPLVSRESDVYAFGMTVLEIYTGQVPFSNTKNDIKALFNVVKGIRPKRPESSEITDELWALICDCWKQDPRQRPSMAILHERLTNQLLVTDGAPQE